jgi:hypothetical protein
VSHHLLLALAFIALLSFVQTSNQKCRALVVSTEQSTVVRLVRLETHQKEGNMKYNHESYVPNGNEFITCIDRLETYFSGFRKKILAARRILKGRGDL